eukprot:GDKJ01004069.1.p1 GENE.GDKJ01004069.1~~GDKJ01004069.1.p1  ORF type:complete len:604 (-),score=256.16 GDKJ01004069.1:1935-3746(-)
MQQQQQQQSRGSASHLLSGNRYNGYQQYSTVDYNLPSMGGGAMVGVFGNLNGFNNNYYAVDTVWNSAKKPTHISSSQPTPGYHPSSYFRASPPNNSSSNTNQHLHVSNNQQAHQFYSQNNNNMNNNAASSSSVSSAASHVHYAMSANPVNASPPLPSPIYPSQQQQLHQQQQQQQLHQQHQHHYAASTLGVFPSNHAMMKLMSDNGFNINHSLSLPSIDSDSVFNANNQLNNNGTNLQHHNASSSGSASSSSSLSQYQPSYRTADPMQQSNLHLQHPQQHQQSHLHNQHLHSFLSQSQNDNSANVLNSTNPNTSGGNNNLAFSPHATPKLPSGLLHRIPSANQMVASHNHPALFNQHLINQQQHQQMQQQHLQQQNDNNLDLLMQEEKDDDGMSTHSSEAALPIVQNGYYPPEVPKAKIPPHLTHGVYNGNGNNSTSKNQTLSQQQDHDSGRILSSAVAAYLLNPTVRSPPAFDPYSNMNNPQLLVNMSPPPLDVLPPSKAALMRQTPSSSHNLSAADEQAGLASSSSFSSSNGQFPTHSQQQQPLQHFKEPQTAFNMKSSSATVAAALDKSASSSLTASPNHPLHQNKVAHYPSINYESIGF